jgi:membrane protease YdiL (CAAX protease family)
MARSRALYDAIAALWQGGRDDRLFVQQGPGDGQRVGVTRREAACRICESLFVSALAVAPLLLIQESLLQFLFANVILITMLIVWARHVDHRPFADYGFCRRWIGSGCPTPVRYRRRSCDWYSVGSHSLRSIRRAWRRRGVIVDDRDIGRRVFDVFVKMLLVAVWEETFFRGFLFTNINGSLAVKSSARRSAIGALLLSSLIFAAGHSGTDHMSVASFAILTLNVVILCISFLLVIRPFSFMGERAWIGGLIRAGAGRKVPTGGRNDGGCHNRPCRRGSGARRSARRGAVVARYCGGAGGRNGSRVCGYRALVRKLDNI